MALQRFKKHVDIFVLQEEKKLGNQVAKGLCATFKHVKQNLPADANPAIVAEIEELLGKESHEWEDFYLIERLLAEIYDPMSLDIELQRRLVDAEKMLPEENFLFYKNKLGELNEDTDVLLKRTLLTRMLGDIQWRYTVKYAKRSHGRVVRNRTAITFILSILPFLALVYSPGFFAGVSSALHIRLEFPMYIAILSGIWGASFSMLFNLKQRLDNSHLDDLRVLRTGGFIFSRLFIGVGAALILYFFLEAGLLSGQALPDLSAIDSANIGTRAADMKNFALLVIWSFLAGFSEKLVPGLLSKTEEKALNSDNNK